jgi:hypothetical protein
MAWNLEGTYFETRHRRQGGRHGRQRPDGRRHRRHAEGHERGNWRLGVFIDSAASNAQAEKLGAVFGGPMAALGPLVSENLGATRSWAA